ALLPMNTSLIIRLCIIGLVILLLMIAWDQLKNANPGMLFIGFIALGTVAGILGVKFLIPWIGDAVGTFFYSSGEEVQMEGSMKAVAKVAQGDYEGAIEEYEEMVRNEPDKPFPIAEMGKIYAEKLKDPQKALAVIQKHLNSREWPGDDAAFLMFRMVDIQLDSLGDFEAARDRLQQIIGAFPNTRHSANAHHRMNEVEQQQFKMAMEQRLKSGGTEA
ncbi:MAG: tetratricopeptide repeat protein, partial [Verrucomicrobiales bacterium]|nr:tetratricopeptide repeat protein [Verrucomicrobiales bacterium]